MIAPDANLLIYAHQPASRFHPQAKAWFEDKLASGETVGIPILSLHSFLRFFTNPTINQHPLTFRQAYAAVDGWLTLPQVRVLHPGELHWQILHQLSEHTRLQGNLVTDAAIAAIAIEHGAVIHTNDRDFARFPNLRWHNPLEA